MEIDFDEVDQKELERKNAEAVLGNIDGILLNGAKWFLLAKGLILLGSAGSEMMSYGIL